MIKIIFFCRRRPDISHEQYTSKLLAGHVPIALRHHPTLRRYVVNIVEQSPLGWDELDSIGELWFESLADFRQRLYDSPEGQRIVERDVAGFMGSANGYVTTEHIQRHGAAAVSRGERSAGVKMMCPVVRRPDLTHDAFVAHWLTRHVPLALRHHPGMSKYVTNVAENALSSTAPGVDGVAELHFPSSQALANGLFDSAEGERIIRADIARFIGRTAAYRVAEYVQL